MAERVRIATFNLENLDDVPNSQPGIMQRIAMMRPQLLRIQADILCLQEINSQEEGGIRKLSALDRLLAETPYQLYHRAFTTMKNSPQPYNERNLVTLSRFPILQASCLRHDPSSAPSYKKVMAIPMEQEAKPVEWERPILITHIDLGSGRMLCLYNCHLKSKIPSNFAGQKINDYTWKSVSAWAEGYFISSMKRVGQALQLRCAIDDVFTQAEVNDTPAFIAVAGDLNAAYDSVALSAIRGPVEETGNPQLSRRVMTPCELSVPESSRYSLLHLGKGQMIDHVLVSRDMLTYYTKTEIHNETLPDESGAFRTDTKFPESDHAPVIAEFYFP
jgi:endonuclease/exonuclease/phosphatase family metal-dependent hydrolase